MPIIYYRSAAAPIERFVQLDTIVWVIPYAMATSTINSVWQKHNGLSFLSKLKNLRSLLETFLNLKAINLQIASHHSVRPRTSIISIKSPDSIRIDDGRPGFQPGRAEQFLPSLVAPDPKPGAEPLQGGLHTSIPVCCGQKPPLTGTRKPIAWRAAY